MAPASRILLELVQCQPEARHKCLEKISHLGKRKLFDGGPERFFRLGELLIAGGDLFEAFEVGTELVRAVVTSIDLYAALISGLKYLTGAGRSPVKTSLASWYSARTATRSASTRPWKRRLRMIASA